MSQLRDASILVTGAGGSIGSALSIRLAELQPRRLVLLDASEQAIFHLKQSLPYAASSTLFALGNIADTALIEELMMASKTTLLFHAAAYKHVALLEEQPLAAIANNALATDTLLQTAHRCGVERVVLLSTDKAVAPTSILGATKHIAEQLTLHRRGIVLRLSNVLGTEGSVVETFLRQIEAKKPLTISDPQAERYFITLDEAVDLLIGAAINATPGTLLVPHLNRAHRIQSLASFLDEQACVEPLMRKETVTEVIGLRAGEKMREELWATDESVMPSSTAGCLEIFSRPQSQSLTGQVLQLRQACKLHDLSEAMHIVQQLVPSYVPSAALTSLVQLSRTGVKP